MKLEKTNLMNTLFEFYGSLLTEKQQEYMQLYFAEDYSFGEIAGEFDVSRQAIYDNIKRTEVLMKEYERKLNMISQYEARREAISNLESYIQKNYPQDTKLVNLVEVVGTDKESARGAEYGI